MTYHEFCKDKLSPFKIQGQTRPFIDANLQLQVPYIENNSENIQTRYTNVYSHYSPYLIPSEFLPIDQNEIEKAMQEAQKSYKNWKEMHQRLLEVSQAYFSYSK